MAQWISAARQRPTFLATALDLALLAKEMISLQLASASDDRVIVAAALCELSSTADRATLIAIARILFLKSPPPWLFFAVREQLVLREYIPQADLEDLAWIEPGLDQFLLSVSSSAGDREYDLFTERFGEAAELFIFSALAKAGRNPVHVAKISDAYGYDIECSTDAIDRIEVKAASLRTKGKFHLSRNEFDKCRLHGNEWRLLQVTFTNQAFLDEKLTINHIESVLELDYSAVLELVPQDTTTFRWTESALITPPGRKWKYAQLQLDGTFITNGFRKGRG